jgi:hypothetical protein
MDSGSMHNNNDEAATNAYTCNSMYEAKARETSLIKGYVLHGFDIIVHGLGIFHG